MCLHPQEIWTTFCILIQEKIWNQSLKEAQKRLLRYHSILIDDNLNQFHELGSKYHTWSCGNLTCTGEQRSSLSPIPICPNCERKHGKDIRSSAQMGLLWDKLPCDNWCRPGQHHDGASPKGQSALAPQVQQTNHQNWAKVYPRTVMKAHNPFKEMKEMCGKGGAQFSHKTS